MVGKLIATFAVVLMALAMISCGGMGDQTVAVVNDYEITMQEFQDYFPSDQFTFASAEDELESKKEALDSIVITRLLVQAAYEKGMDESEELARVVLANKDNFLLDALYKMEVSDRATASDTEIRNFYEKLDTRIRLSQMIIADRDTAQAVFERLTAGESFDKLAYDYSLVPSAKKDKGDLGYITWGALLDEAQEVAFQMQPGELSPPIESFLGYHILKVHDRVPNEERRSLEAMKDDISQQIIGLKSYRLTRQFFDYLKEKYPIKIDTATCQYVLHKRETMYPPQLLSTLPRNDFDQEQLDRNEKELVLATWNGGQMTLLQYLTQVSVVPRHIRPDLDDYDSLATIIFVIKRNDMMVIEAYERGLDADDDFQRKLRLFKELNMAEMMHNDSVPKPPDPDEGMIRQYYDEHPDEFMSPAKVRVYEILLRDELKANQLKEQIRTKAQFKDKAMELTERPGRRPVGGDLDYFSRDAFPEIFDAAWGTPVGQMSGPVLDRGKYSLFWVEDKVDPELKDFLGVKRGIFEKLVLQNNQAAFEAWVNDRRSKSDIRLNMETIEASVDREKYTAVGSGE
ncbi:MAG: peptidyl-prolyl cis-trans isomerase [bacterium]